MYIDVHREDMGKSQLEHFFTRGIYKHSIATDPLFKDISKGDFGLLDNSPAYDIGFIEIDMSAIGITKYFPKPYIEIAKQQLGREYNSILYLEKCAEEKKKLIFLLRKNQLYDTNQ